MLLVLLRERVEEDAAGPGEEEGADHQAVQRLADRPHPHMAHRRGHLPLAGGRAHRHPRRQLGMLHRLRLLKGR